MPEYFNNKQLFKISKGDISALRADAEVVIREQLKPGEVVQTDAAGETAERFRYVFYTCGPDWKGGFSGEEAILRSCYCQALQLARELDCHSVVFPLISAESSGFPPEKALEIAVTTINEFLQYGPEMQVTLAIYGAAERALAGVFVPGAGAFPKRPRPVFANSAGRNASRKAARTADSIPFGAAPLAAAEALREAESLSAEALRDAEFLSVKIPEEGIFSSLPSAYSPESDEDPLLGESLADMILRLGRERNMTDPQIYKAANLSRAAFNKIVNGKTLNPSRQTVAAIAIALKLAYPEAEALMTAAGLAFADNNAFDVIVASCIRSGFYDLWKINCALADRNLPLLGSGSL